MQTQAEALFARGRYRDAQSVLHAQSSLSTSEKVLLAYMQAHCEGPASVASRAASLLELNLEPGDKARCLEIVGRAAGHRGDLQTGLSLLEEAVRTASRDPSLAARLEYQLVKSLLNWVGVEPVLVRLPRLRKAATASGDSYATVGLHLICAEIEMKRDDKEAADSHVAIATGLLHRFPNLAQEARLLQIRANYAGISSDFRAALRLAEAALEKIDEAGLTSVRAVVVSNIGHFLLHTGQLVKVPHYLNSQRSLFGHSGSNAISEGSTELELALANNDLQRASELAESIQAISSRLEGGYSYYGLWFLLVRVRWLMRIGRPSEALRIAEDALPFVQSMAADSLSVRLRLRAAEAAARNTNIESGLKYLSEVLLTPHLPTAAIGEIARVAAILSARQPGRSASLFTRATRILDHAGLLTAAAEAKRNQLEAGAALPVIETGVTDPDPWSAGSEIVEAWLTIADVVTVPALVGSELLTIVRATGAARAAALVKACDNNQFEVVESFNWTDQQGVSASGVVSIAVGNDADASWRLDVLPKPEASARLTIIEVQALLDRLRRRQETSIHQPLLGSPLADETSVDSLGMVSAAAATKELLNITRRVATSNATVLFTGETGTGKELLARALHDASPRREKPFMPFNCSAVARDMLDSQLFGYRRGAFTGALDAFPGVIRAAAGGTLFLDEIGEISLEVQPKLLRFLESGEIHPLGEPKPITVDVRVVAATNAKLEDLVAQGRFREDLFYRLNVVRLHVPPLRERREEIPLLVQHFLDRFSRESHKTGIRIADETLEYLILFAWPGNVRQLANEVRRLVALAEPGAVLMPEHLSPAIAASRRTVPPSERDPAPSEFVVRMDQPLSAAIEHLERSMIQYALARAGDRLEDAAEILGISRKGLYLKRLRFRMADATVDEDDTHGSEARAKKLG